MPDCTAFSLWSTNKLFSGCEFALTIFGFGADTAVCCHDLSKIARALSMILSEIFPARIMLAFVDFKYLLWKSTKSVLDSVAIGLLRVKRDKGCRGPYSSSVNLRDARKSVFASFWPSISVSCRLSIESLSEGNVGSANISFRIGMADCAVRLSPVSDNTVWWL